MAVRSIGETNIHTPDRNHVCTASVIIRVCLMLVALLFTEKLRAEDASLSSPITGLTERINQRISAGWNGRGIKPAENCSDREFVRRTYLDLAGRVPSVDELDAFLAESSSDKRMELVDSLLASEAHVQHLTDLMDALLMGRVNEKKYAQRSSSQWRSYLATSIRENRPWNEVAAEILLARPEDKENRGVVWFLYERNNDHQAIAESIAPAFFGVRIECAQCHDHMIADEIKQSDYWGLVAFFNRGQNKSTNAGPRVVESAVGGFSEFTDLFGESYPNRLTFLGSDPVNEKRPATDEKQEDTDFLYAAVTGENAPKLPLFSRRRAFVDQVVNQNPRLALAMVNRIWAIMMARGIVHPFDEMDSVHPPSHPELLQILADDFVANGYDIRRLIRSIALSHAYQLSSIRPTGVDDPASFAWYLERPLTAEQLTRSMLFVVRGETQLQGALTAAFRQQFRDVLPDTFVAPVADALHLSNHAALDEFLRQSNDANHLRPRLLELPETDQRIDQLFRTIFHRVPDPTEKKMVADYLEKRAENLGVAMDQVIWSMLTSAEFRLNH